jgi:hypothetical protein
MIAIDGEAPVCHVSLAIAAPVSRGSGARSVLTVPAIILRLRERILGFARRRNVEDVADLATLAIATAIIAVLPWFSIGLRLCRNHHTETGVLRTYAAQ